jgi:hypothetical protein
VTDSSGAASSPALITRGCCTRAQGITELAAARHDGLLLPGAHAEIGCKRSTACGLPDLCPDRGRVLPCEKGEIGNWKSET